VARVRYALLGAAALVAATSPPARVSARYEKQTIALVCTVPRDPANRWLGMSVQDDATELTASIVQLDGDNAPMTFRLVLPHLDCDPAEPLTGYCILQYVPDGVARAKTNLPCR
jgi:hypothetical protein